MRLKMLIDINYLFSEVQHGGIDDPDYVPSSEEDDDDNEAGTGRKANVCFGEKMGLDVAYIVRLYENWALLDRTNVPVCPPELCKFCKQTLKFVR